MTHEPTRIEQAQALLQQAAALLVEEQAEQDKPKVNGDAFFRQAIREAREGGVDE